MDTDPWMIKPASSLLCLQLSADGSFKTEKLKTGGSPTTKLFSESFLQFFHCQSQLKDVRYRGVTREKRTSTCMPGNFCVSASVRSVTRHCGSRFQSVCFFHLAPCPLPSFHPLLWIFLHTILSNHYPLSLLPQSPSKRAAGLGHTWPICGATAKALYFPACYRAHYQTANSASSWDFAQQATDNTSKFLLTAPSL